MLLLSKLILFKGQKISQFFRVYLWKFSSSFLLAPNFRKSKNIGFTIVFFWRKSRFFTVLFWALTCEIFKKWVRKWFDKNIGKFIERLWEIISKDMPESMPEDSQKDNPKIQDKIKPNKPEQRVSQIWQAECNKISVRDQKGNAAKPQRKFCKCIWCSKLLPKTTKMYQPEPTKPTPILHLTTK